MNDILLVMDKLKGSISAAAACDAIKAGILNANLKINVKTLPMADGGDGTLAVLKQLDGFESISHHTIDPLGRSIEAYYLVKQGIAYIELAIASGIVHLGESELDVMHTTTNGTGVLVQHAIEQGCQEIVLCLGGSCTTDLGLGILSELGFKYYDQHNHEVLAKGASLLAIHAIEQPDLDHVKFTVFADVENPLYGPDGAAHVFASQKGASAVHIRNLDYGLRHVSSIIQAQTGIDISTLSGGGAAGGIAAGLYGLVGAELVSGFDALADMLEFDQEIQQSKYVITGEGKVDQSSLKGKIVGKILQKCQDLKKPCGLIAGSMKSKLDKLHHETFWISTITEKSQSMQDAMSNPEKYLFQIGEELAQYITQFD